MKKPKPENKKKGKAAAKGIRGRKKGGERKGEEGGGECEDGKRGEKTGAESKRKQGVEKSGKSTRAAERGREKGGKQRGISPSHYINSTIASTRLRVPRAISRIDFASM